jgi:hypothetical protein
VSTETLLSDAPAAPDTPAPAEPAYLARARRILNGDVRADDYPQPTPEVEAALARDLAFAPADLATVARLRAGHFLSAHFATRNVAVLETAAGPVVLAVGLDQCAELMRAIPYAQRRVVELLVPEPADTVRA